VVVVFVRGYGVTFLCRGKILSLLGEGRCGGGAVGREKGLAGVVSLGLPCSLVGCNGGGGVAQHWDEGFRQIHPGGSVSLDRSPR
jgi:hypothetical protein